MTLSTEKRISFYNQGCRLNQAETAVLEQGFKAVDFTVVPFSEPCDVVVVNTCTVTENGDADTRRLVNKINRENPGAKIALVGCQAQILKDQLLKLPGVTWVVGNQLKMSLPTLLTEPVIDTADKAVWVPKIARESFVQETTGVDPKRTRANLKIQDGCDFYCAFCTIPFARGPARSRVFDDIIREATDLVVAGHQELVLTGINIGTYADSGKDVMDVLDALEAIPGLNRIRISSIEPTTIPKELIYRMRDSEKLCRYLHIPIQAATDPVLAAMNRKYDLKTFQEFIQFAYETVPDICIGTDVIVGFPGETQALFDEGEAFLREAPIHYFHVFSYSERQMARSKRLDHQVPAREIADRSAKLRALSSRKKTLYLTQFLGQSHDVLFEQEKNGYWWGHTDHYVKVGVKSDQSLKNQVIACQLDSVKGAAVIGTLS